MKLDLTQMEARQKTLQEAKDQLKKEFFGLDKIIDRVIDSIYAWYVFPQLIARPVIVNLWGMTGVGKTQLVRRLTQLLNFQDKYAEVQMDGFSGGYYTSTISSILRNSAIEEGQMGILMLDEIQRFKTIDETGADAKVERYQDVWQLLSDGKFAADSSLFKDIEQMVCQHLYRDDRKDEDKDEPEDDKPKKPRKFQMGPWEAGNLKQTLRLQETIQEIMTWSYERVQAEIAMVRKSRSSWEIDYTKLLIFISGNLDEAFAAAGSTDDCDTDADIYHQLTSKISVTDIKKALNRRFRPEQVARMGNNHIIYPSLSRDSYERLIRASCDRYVNEMVDLSGIQFNIEQEIYEEIYRNAVYPTQGTRPVFSSVHKIFSSALSSFAVWGVENGYREISITLLLDGEDQFLVGTDDVTQDTLRVKIDLDLRKAKSKNSQDFLSLVAVHEAGHAVVYAALYGTAPREVKINLASFKGGYMMHNSGDKIFTTKEAYLDRACVAYGGAAAEELVFGEGMRANGCFSDIQTATKTVSSYIRSFGFDGNMAWTAPTSDPNTMAWNTSVKDSDPRVVEICNAQFERAKVILNDNREMLAQIAQLLIEGNTLTVDDFCKMFPWIQKEEQEAPYGDKALDWINQNLPEEECPF